MAESPRNRDMQAPAGQPDESVPPPDKVPGARITRSSSAARAGSTR